MDLPLLQHLSAASVVGMMGIAVIANLFPGIPEELPLLGIGVAIGSGLVSFPLALLVVWATLFVVDNGMFLMARRGARVVVWMQRRIFGDSIDLKSAFITNNLDTLVFCSRFIVHVRFLGIFVAGVHKMPWKRFALLQGISLALYLTILLSLGSYFHGRVERLLHGVGVVKNIMVIAIVILLVFIIGRAVYVRIMRHLRGEEESRIFTFLGLTKISKTPSDSKDGLK